MMIPVFLPRNIVGALVVLLLASSCATTDLIVMEQDEAQPGARAWVAFIEDGTQVYIRKVVGGVEGGTLRIKKGKLPVAIPCEPGDNEFAIYDKTGLVEHLVVPAAEGAVTYVGIRMVVLEWRWVPQNVGGTWRWVATPVRYLVRSSVGSHPLPADAAAADPVPYFAALEDADWATRMIAIGNLERVNPVLDERQWMTLATLSREDSSAPVWQAAGQFFRRTRNQMPDPPMAIAYFDRSVYGLPLESNNSVAASLVSQGYQMESKLEKQSVWEMLRSSTIRAVQNIEYALECSWVAGATSGAFGLTVGYDDNNFNAFCVTKDGEAAVLAFRGGSLRSTPIEWRQDLSDEIRGSEVVRIGVSRRRADYTMTVNGKPVGTFTDKDMRSGLVGLFLNGRQTVVYRKLVVFQPPQAFVPRK
jgi:hypothetical protein